MLTIAERILQFNAQLSFDQQLPAGINIMNPFTDPYIREVTKNFYSKYYNDDKPRHLLLGINPGRFGGGLTGVPFTDPKRLINECGIPYAGAITHEPSSDYVYQMIKAYGGPRLFYSKFYINSVCPLGFVKINERQKEVNYNYYDSPQLTATMTSFIVKSIKQQITIGMATDVCFCFGTGQNKKFLEKQNQQHQFFGKVNALEHPRFIMQYKSKARHLYIQSYLDAFASLKGY